MEVGIKVFNKNILLDHVERPVSFSNEEIKFFALTGPQESIFYDQMLYPDNPCYNIGAYLKIYKSTDDFILKQALSRLTLTHDVLRLKIVREDVKIFQVFKPVADESFSYLGNWRQRK